MARLLTPNVSNAKRDFIHQRFARSGSRDARYGYTSLLTRFERSVNDCKTGSVQPHHVEDFFYGPGGLADTCQRQTLGKYRNDMKQFFAWVHRRRWNALSADALLEGVPDKSTRTNRNRYRMTRDELRHLLAHAEHPRDAALICFVACTGVRISEAKGMRIGDVSFNKSELYLTIPKTHEEITYPLTSDLEAQLRLWLAFYTEQVGKLRRTYYLFPAFKRRTFAEGGGLTPAGLLNPEGEITHPTKVLRPIADRAEIELEEGDGWHTLRRSFARILYDDLVHLGHDAALRIVQAALNHKSVQTTERYLGLDLERQQLARALKGKPFLILGDEAGKIVSLTDRRAGNG
ncbi:tyrosine-type recombinase/integrase [Streptomyces sp. DH10]|uniref:tyrosine-type recombinase/integrase n=1 Tax=Streptomyces sp. DH10 TaxID=3040121 RepID=UPI0024415F87|nr:site-specific integrase [Streptomyces sp. DH10]MDG9711178.1 site-specific integrase [Streptomyces sp. DH10]